MLLEEEELEDGIIEVNVPNTLVNKVRDLVATHKFPQFVLLESFLWETVDVLCAEKYGVQNIQFLTDEERDEIYNQLSDSIVDGFNEFFRDFHKENGGVSPRVQGRDFFDYPKTIVT